MSTGLLYLIRHGETEWSRSGQHTGLTDLPLLPSGEAGARALRPRLGDHDFALVLTSPLIRAVDTARLAGLKADTDPDLKEWDYGAYEGRTTPDIRAGLNDPAWTIWRDPIPPGDTPGEQPEQVAERTRRVLARCDPYLEQGRDCALVAHGHLLRILTATWLGLTAVDARFFLLDAATISTLGFDHRQHVIRSWNTS